MKVLKRLVYKAASPQGFVSVPAGRFEILYSRQPDKGSPKMLCSEGILKSVADFEFLGIPPTKFSVSTSGTELSFSSFLNVSVEFTPRFPWIFHWATKFAITATRDSLSKSGLISA